MRIEEGISNITIRYQKNNNNKKMAILESNNKEFHKHISVDHLQDESKQLSFVYTSAQAYLDAMDELHSTSFLTRDEILRSISDLENSLTLVPGSSINLTSASNEIVILSVGTSYNTISYGTTPIGTSYLQKKNALIRKMLPETDPSNPPDLSMLTKEQLAILKRMENEQYLAATQIGGVNEYEVLHKISESFGSLIRFANGQIPSIPQDSMQYIKIGLDKAGIDTAKPFYINGQKLQFNNEDRMILLQEE